MTVFEIIDAQAASLEAQGCFLADYTLFIPAAFKFSPIKPFVDRYPDLMGWVFIDDLPSVQLVHCSLTPYLFEGDDQYVKDIGADGVWAVCE